MKKLNLMLVLTWTLLIFTQPVEAIILLDQSFLNGNAGSSSGLGRLAQTFTVGLDGLLNKVNININGLENSFLDIYATDNSSPAAFGSSILASVRLDDVPFSGIPTLVEADFSPFLLTIDEGDLLALVLHGDNIQWAGGLRDFVPDYPDGDAFVPMRDGSWVLATSFGGGDFHFQTFVETNPIPEPLTATLGLMGLATLGMATRRRAA